MTTFDSLTTEIVQELLGWSRDQEQATYLTQAAASGDTTLNVANASRTSRGLAEIEDELVWVDTFDSTNNLLQVAPYGRGYQGTTAASHAQNTRVVYNPRFPRQVVKRAVNEVIDSVADQLWTTVSTTFSYAANVTTYALPANTLQVLEVSWQSVGPSQYWWPVKRWKFDRHANTTAFPTGRSIDLLEAIVPGRTVQVTYTQTASELVNGSDDFTTVSGLPASAKDVVKYGVMAKLAAALQVSNLDTTSLEADALDQQGQGAVMGANLSKYFMQLHLQRLEQEKARLWRQNPVTVHRTI